MTSSTLSRRIATYVLYVRIRTNDGTIRVYPMTSTFNNLKYRNLLVFVCLSNLAREMIVTQIPLLNKNIDLEDL